MEMPKTLTMRAISGMESEVSTIVHSAEMARLRAKYESEMKDAMDTYIRACNAVNRAYAGRLLEIMSAQDQRNGNAAPTRPAEDGGTENAW